MKSIIMNGADYSTQRVSVPELNLPAIGRALKHILIANANKYNVTTGILQDPIAGDWQHSAFVTNGEKPATISPMAMGSKLCFSFVREALKRKDLKGTLNCENTKWTISFSYANSNALATATNRVLFSFLSTLENGSQSLLRYYSTGSAGVTRLLMSQSAGSLVFGTSVNVTTLPHNLNLVSTNSMRTNISIVGDSETQQIKVYTNGILTETLASNYVRPLKGDMYLGVSLTIADETSDFYGQLGQMVIHDDALTATECAAMHTFFTTAFS